MSLSILLFFFPYIVLSLPENEIEFERQENYDAESIYTFTDNSINKTIQCWMGKEDEWLW